MSIFQVYLTGLLLAHLVWFFFFTSGQLLRPITSDESVSYSLAQFVVSSVAGMALTGFALLFLGFSHLLNGFGIAGALLLEGVLFWLLRGDNWLSWIFWRGMFERFVRPWGASTLFVYLVFLVLGVPAVLPPTLSDSVTYHLAYAVDWANAGRIYVDPFLRFPYYANNFLLLYSALFVLKLGNYCHFLTWLCGLLTCLGVQSFFTPPEPRFPRQVGRHNFSPQQFLIPLCVALNPVFLPFLNVAMLDVPIGLFVLIPILCAYRGSSLRPLERELVVTAAFCVGMKLTLIGHLPFFFISLVFVSACRLRRREIALLSLLLLGLSLPWYIRNFIQTHDPTPPIFNSYLKHPDPIFTQDEAARVYGSAMITERGPLHLLLLPFRCFAEPLSRNFREYGVNTMITLLYAPILFLVAQLFWRRRHRPPERLIYLSAAVAYLAFPWFFCSLGRYSLHWYPALAAWAGASISYFQARSEAAWNSRFGVWTTRVITTAVSCVLIYPHIPQGCMRFYRDHYSGTVPLFRSRDDLQVYLEKKLNGYRASQAVIAALAFDRNGGRVLTFGDELAFYFRKAKIISVGDFFGPARYRDLFNEVSQGDCRSYLNRLDISAVLWILDPRDEASWHGFYEDFRWQLKKNHFTEYRYRTEQILIFLKSDIKPTAELNRVMQ